MSTVTLTINSQEVTIPKGTTVLDAAVGAGFFVPTFCHDPVCLGYGGYRICIVDIKGARNLPASCVTAAGDGMIVETESPAVVEVRKTIIELMLANHPVDCMTSRNVATAACRTTPFAMVWSPLDLVAKEKTTSLMTQTRTSTGI